MSHASTKILLHEGRSMLYKKIKEVNKERDRVYKDQEFLQGLQCDFMSLLPLLQQFIK